MTKKRKIAFLLYMLVFIISFVFAVLYLFMPKFMPYHSVAVGLKWAQVGKNFQVLILALMRVVGGGFLAATVSGIFILFKSFKKGESWANLAILISGLAITIPALSATLYVKYYTPASPPWIGSIVGIIILITGFIFGLEKKA